MRGERIEAGRIDHRNGAWLIQMFETNEGDGDRTPDALFDCAGGQAEARRVARHMATELGWHGPFRWVQNAYKSWWLWATNDIFDPDSVGEE